ncbi:protein BCCIP homolog isoform X1 [Amaranthus tricolor]|uniref:protein BCCIP homolog isoform X1 n=1 Tax=Amaranthus tricolor TaxID=29722 RepID=UPI0025877C19|nr:protein BCCIP homolog isoform X1 [Amaranthus tricolor]XP_057544577.1 protein BCCIP homolog isoform X1 [Amaranthus tricolor]
MPRKPRRSGQLLPRPLAFSPFARSVARFANACSSKRIVSNSKSDGMPSSKLLASGTSRHCLKEKDPESGSSEEEISEEVIQADFAFFDPKPDDFHGVKILLQSYLDDKEWDLSGFVDLILAQTTVGSVVKIEDDEDEGLFALLTALNLGRYEENKCITEIKGYLLKVCEQKSFIGQLKRLLNEHAEHVGLMVSQRVMNLPPQLLPHLYDALFDEISWATEDEPTEDLRKSFRFKYFLLITRIYKKIHQNKKGSTSSNDEDIIYVKPEDELFYELCSWSFTFPLHNQPPTTQELKNYRLMGLVMVVEADKVPVFRQKVRSLIDDS